MINPSELGFRYSYDPSYPNRIGYYYGESDSSGDGVSEDDVFSEDSSEEEEDIKLYQEKEKRVYAGDKEEKKAEEEEDEDGSIDRSGKYANLPTPPVPAKRLRSKRRSKKELVERVWYHYPVRESKKFEVKYKKLDPVLKSTGDYLEIDLIEPPVQDFDWPLEHLPKPPFRATLTAPSNSGKTNLILNLLQENRYGGWFPRIYVICPTLNHDPKYQLLKSQRQSRNIIFYTECSEELILHLEKEAKERVARDKGVHKRSNASLCLYDDCIIDLFAAGNKPTEAGKAYIRGRHWNQSIGIVSQAYMLVNKTIRTNCSMVICHPLNNVKEEKALFDEHGGGFTRSDWDDLTHSVWSQPHSFLFIDYTKQRNVRYRKDLNEVCIHYSLLDLDEDNRRGVKRGREMIEDITESEEVPSIAKRRRVTH